MVQRKILLVPYIRCGRNKSRVVIVQHAESGDWTFISGTCEAGEGPVPCVIRELNEETMGNVIISKLPRQTKKIRVHITATDTRIDIFFIPVRNNSKMFDGFLQAQDDFARGVTGENNDLAFMTFRQFLRKRVWSFLSDHVFVDLAFQRELRNLKLIMSDPSD